MGKFITFIREVEGLPLYKRLAREGIIIRKSLPGAKVLMWKNAPALAEAGVIAKIEKRASFSIHYTREEFSIEYLIDDEKLRRSMNSLKLMEEEKKNTTRLLNKLRRINTRNLIVHEILKGIVEHQRDYLGSNNELDLKPLTRAELAGIISNSKESSHSFGLIMDASRISRVTRGLSVITPGGEEVSLSFFFRQ